MSIIRIDPNLIDNTGASDGDVLKFVSANGSVEFGFAGDVSNTWVNANDHSTYSTLSGLINTVQDNVESLTSTAAANDYNTYTTVVGLIDTVQDNVATLDNNVWVNANDFATYTSLTASINTVQANLTSLVSAAPSTLDTLAEIAAALENDANIAVTLTTAIGTVQSNVTTLTGIAAANDYNTYNTLSGLIDTVQDNVSSSTSNTSIVAGGTDLSNTTVFIEAGDGVLLSSNTTSKTLTIATSMSNVTSQTIAIDGSANSFSLTKSASNSNMVLVMYNGLVQDPARYTLSGSTLSLVNTAPLIAGANLEVRYFDFFSLPGVSESGAGPVFQGTVSGYVSGGAAIPAASEVNTIDKFPFAADANATDVGDLTASRNGVVGQSSTVSGYSSGGNASGNTIDKFPFSADANATDVGDLTVARSEAAGQSSTVSGYASGGSTPSSVNTIDKFPFAADANATDVGDITASRYGAAGQSSTESGYSSGGRDLSSPSSPTYGSPLNTIDKFPFASDANATDVGDLTQARFINAGQSSSSHGYTTGGQNPAAVVTIDKFTFSADANATDVGDLSRSPTALTLRLAGQSSTESGYSTGGYQANIIDKFSFSADGNSTDVGDLTQARNGSAGQQV